MRIEETVINIVFDAGKGSVAIKSREGVEGQRFGPLPQPARSGHIFAGWYLGEEEITENTVISSKEDLRLVARWEKKTRKRATMLVRQRVTAVVLAVVIVALAAALAVANRVVGIYSLKDTFVNEAGEAQTIKYTIKKEKSTGLYALFNKKGEKMAVVEDNGFNNYTSGSDGVQYLVYETDVSGNQYRINTSTGEYERYAVVDTEEDEILGGTVVSTRVMMYRLIEPEKTYSIEVANRYGSWSVYQKTVENTAAGAKTPYTSVPTVSANGADVRASCDQTLYASLWASCGYSLTEQKLDLKSAGAPRDENGNIRYDVYGLSIVTDEYGNVDYSRSPAVYTIRKGETAADGSVVPTGEAYTVYVGDAILSGNGYYVKRADRDMVYIVSSRIADTVLKPVESMVTAQAVYPLGETTYAMVEQFAFRRVNYNSETGEILSDKLITEFSYIDMAERRNTIYSLVPYRVPAGSPTQLLRGYELNFQNVTATLRSLYEMKFLACVKLSPSEEDMKKYHLDGDISMLSFLYDPGVARGGSGNSVLNTLLISRKQSNDKAFGQDVYYIYSGLYDMIVAVDPYYVSFEEWEQSAWYDPSFFQNNLAYVRDLHFTFGDRQYDFILDNRASDQTNGPSTTGLKVICPQYQGSDDHVLNYTIQVDEETDKGTISTKTYSTLQNFQNFYLRLVQYAIEGDVNAAEFKNDKRMTVEEFIASDVNDDKALAKISCHVEDYAAIANTAKDANGNPLYTENNKFDAVIRFYSYGSGYKLLLTVEIIDTYAADGTPVPNAANAQGNFYVLASPLGDIADCIEDLLNAVFIPGI